MYTVPMDRSRRRDAKAVIESYLTGKPIVIRRDCIREMSALLEKLVANNNFNIIHADQTSMAMYALAAFEHHDKFNKPKTVLDQHNALYKVVKQQARYMRGFSRQVWRREASLLATYESDLCQRFGRVLTVTQNDKNALKALFDSKEQDVIDMRISVVPICMDPTAELMVDYRHDGSNIIFVGTMVWPPNIDGIVWFSKMILPEIIRSVPGVHLTIVGKDPPAEVKALVAADSPISGSAEVTGFVSNLEPYISRSRVFIVPILAGGGMRVKIIDAWQKGIPVVSTKVGAEGLEIEQGTNILLADKPKDFAKAVISVLKDDRLAKHLRENGRRTVELHYDYRRVYHLIDDVYKDIGRDES